MVEIGDRPLLWHLMKYYGAFGHKDFVIALGYKSEVVKRYFLDVLELSGALTIDFSSGKQSVEPTDMPPWNVTLLDTGLSTGTAGRIRRARRWLGESTFMVTYGDGLADVDLNALVEFHRSHGRLVTVTAVRPPAHFGMLTLEGPVVEDFREKPPGGGGWINGGFFVLEPSVYHYLDDDQMMWERVLERIARDGQVMAFRHEGFFQPMDTVRDRNTLQELWRSGKAPWSVG